MKKHYVKVMRQGRIVSDAFIEAPTPSGALKLAMAGHGLDLARIKPDEHYTVQCGDAMGSAYGDEFADVAEYAGDDIPRHEDGAHLRPRPAAVYGDPCRHIFNNDVNLYPPSSGIIQEAIRRTTEHLARRVIADALEKSLGIPADLLGIQPITASRQPVMPQQGSIQMELEFDFKCDCGNVERHKTKFIETPNMIYYTAVVCSACGQTHNVSIER